MSCTWQTKLDPYVDAELPAAESAEMEAHLRECASCAADALGRLQLKRMTYSAGQRYAPSPEFRVKVRHMVEKRTASRRRWTWGWMPKLAAAAVAAVLVFAVAGVWLRHSQRDRALSELADLHVATLASPNPVDVISSDRHTVKPWFQGKVPFTFNLPELQNTAFKLVGGRVAYLDQSAGAQLLFEVRKHHISVFIFPESSGISRLAAGLTSDSRMAFNFESWSRDGLRYFLVTDATPADLQALSELLKHA